MGVFEFFYNFMYKVIDLITTTPCSYLFFTIFVIWGFHLFFDIVRVR